ncbi:hypothetical protein F4677DRAFT_438493 [Hypoxylon crocopeplum]|nr:hypothetical protein F4677DRAFT_438493 [Hypoxylon crocopeplum]
MAVIRNDVNEVTHILRRFPGSLAEVNIYGQSPLHLAATKPRILTLLIEAADLTLLKKTDKLGFTVLETAMRLSSMQCVNGSNFDRCRHCACTQCVGILLEAGCDVRMHELEAFDTPLSLSVILNNASELARRRYVFHMKELRSPRPQRLSLHQCLPIRRIVNGTDTTRDGNRAEPSISRSPEEPRAYVENDEVEDWSWIYHELTNPHSGELFYRHGFRLHPCFFIHSRGSISRTTMSYDYIRWLVEHGADLFLRSSTGPPATENSSNIGLFGAHYALYPLGFCVRYTIMRQQCVEDMVALNKLNAATEHRNLTDGCNCYCSTRGCSPFIWMMKGMMSERWSGEPDPDPDLYVKYMLFYYSGCGPDLTILTYKAAIRYVTFRTLGLTHTCCSPDSIMDDEEEWVERDDVDIINEEQASLLELHEELVAEFEKEALKFIKHDSNGRSLFPDFWLSYWIVRIKEVLEELDCHELTDAERRGAESIGVRWCEPVEKEKNPYDSETLEYYLCELDLVCPEYKEPWPDELRRVTELPYLEEVCERLKYWELSLRYGNSMRSRVSFS